MSVLSPVSAYLLRLLTSRGSRSKGCGFWRVAIASGSSRGHDRVKAVRGGMEGSIIAKNTGPTEVQVASCKLVKKKRKSSAQSSLLYDTEQKNCDAGASCAGTPLCDNTFLVMQRQANHVAFLSHCSYCPIDRNARTDGAEKNAILGGNCAHDRPYQDQKILKRTDQVWQTQHRL